MAKLLSISGGATEIANLAGCAIGIMRGYNPDIFAGVSAGAILALPLALGKLHLIESLVKDFSLDDIFDKDPFGRNGGVSLNGALRVVSGRPSLGSMAALADTLSSVVSEKEFKTLKKEVYVAATNYSKGEQTVFKLNDLDYSTAINAIVASASIPIITEPVRIGGDLFFDGGILDHNIANKVLTDRAGITHARTIYVRDPQSDWRITNIFSVIKKTISLMTKEISVSDETIERKICKEKGIDYRTYILESQMKSLFDTDPDRLLSSFLYGYSRSTDLN